jgi:aromatic ring hydroxylase
MTTTLTTGTGAMNGDRYLESLRDGREVWLNGERIADVTTHPAFATVCQSIARAYDLQCAPETRRTCCGAGATPRCGHRRHSAWSGAFPTSAPRW